MISSVSLNGMQAAAANFYKSAQNIVESGMQTAQTIETPDIPVTAVAGTRPSARRQRLMSRPKM